MNQRNCGGTERLTRDSLVILEMERGLPCDFDELSAGDGFHAYFSPDTQWAVIWSRKWRVSAATQFLRLCVELLAVCPALDLGCVRGRA